MTVEIKVPDIGDFKDIPVIEVHVEPGQKIAVDDPLVTLESDKATMDIPAPQAGHRGRAQGQGRRPGVAWAAPSSLLEAEGAAAIPPKERIKEGAAPPRASPRATARVPASTRRSRSRSRTSATSRTCRSSRSMSQKGADGQGRGPADLAGVRQGHHGRARRRPRARWPRSRSRSGDRVSEGDLILTLADRRGQAAAAAAPAAAPRLADAQARLGRQGRPPCRGAGAGRRPRRLHGGLPRRRPRQEGDPGRALADPWAASA